MDRNLMDGPGLVQTGSSLDFASLFLHEENSIVFLLGENTFEREGTFHPLKGDY